MGYGPWSQAMLPLWMPVPIEAWSLRPLSVVLVKRSAWPHAGKWALPGGFVGIDESLKRAAWRELREAQRRGALTDSADGCLLASRRLHAALNATAGRVVFADEVDSFVAASPRFAPLREELARFFSRSREGFFAAAPRADLNWLLDVARALRDAERGTA